MVTLVDEDAGLENGVPIGALWTLVGAIGYAVYLVFLRRCVDRYFSILCGSIKSEYICIVSEEALDIPMFFGFVGLFSAAIFWPAIYVLHASSIEPFYPLPNRTQMMFVVVNGLIGTVLSEYLWLWGCFLTGSSLMATLSLSMTVPLTVMADAVLWKQSYPWQFFVGVVPILAAFFGSALLAQ